eukprot:TRINITY_DN9324_c0_g1_i1.p1 TRINITY_DN9324_c0_g1~~TRINITY_DN9324_c0_g1_i1.p1  ORF type:complete len:502 (-),score=109.71 TRINITY_DN9324_c0_g1_i1:138-1583(-)
MAADGGVKRTADGHTDAVGAGSPVEVVTDHDSTTQPRSAKARRTESIAQEGGLSAAQLENGPTVAIDSKVESAAACTTDVATSAADELAAAKRRALEKVESAVACTTDAATSVADELAAAKRRALEEAKRAALARIFEELEAPAAATSGTVSASDALAIKERRAPSKPFGLRAKTWNSATGEYEEEELPDDVQELMGLQDGRPSCDVEVESDNEEPPPPGDRSIMDFLREQGSQAVGKVFSEEASSLRQTPGLVASAAPVFQKRELKGSGCGGRGASTGDIVPVNSAGNTLSSRGRVVGSPAPKQVGHWSVGGGSGGVMFSAKQQEIEKQQRDQESQRQEQKRIFEEQRQQWEQQQWQSQRQHQRPLAFAAPKMSTVVPPPGGPGRPGFPFAGSPPAWRAPVERPKMVGFVPAGASTAELQEAAKQPLPQLLPRPPTYAPLATNGYCAGGLAPARPRGPPRPRPGLGTPGAPRPWVPPPEP